MRLGITGHRPAKLGGYGLEVAERCQRLAGLKLKEMGPTCVVTGMALGHEDDHVWVYDVREAETFAPR